MVGGLQKTAGQANSGKKMQYHVELVMGDL